MQRLEVSGAVRPIYGSLGVKRLNQIEDIINVGAIFLIPFLVDEMAADRMLLALSGVMWRAVTSTVLNQPIL